MDGAGQPLHPPDLGNRIQFLTLPALGLVFGMHGTIGAARDADLAVALIDYYLLAGMNLRVSIPERPRRMTQTDAGERPVANVVVFPTIRADHSALSLSLAIANRSQREFWQTPS